MVFKYPKETLEVEPPKRWSLNRLLGSVEVVVKHCKIIDNGLNSMEWRGADGNTVPMLKLLNLYPRFLHYFIIGTGQITQKIIDSV